MPPPALPLWAVDLAQQFGMQVPTWGFSGSPLVVGDRVYVQGNEAAALAAFDLFSGQAAWQVAGKPLAYASLMPTDDNQLIVGVSQDGYFARNAENGDLVWSFQPEYSGDFGVPSPVLFKGGVVFASENNGIQLIGRTKEAWEDRAKAIDDRLIPDSHTPVSVRDTLLVAYDGVHALDLKNGLVERWSVGGAKVTTYASLIASADRALATTEAGGQLLMEIATGKVLDERSLTDQRLTVLSHPAVCQDRLIVRVGQELRCYRFTSR